MQSFIKMALGVTLGMAFAAQALASDQASKEDAVAMVKQAIAYYKAHGQDKTVAEIMAKNPLFVKGALYVTVADINGTSLAHPMAPKMNGRNVIDLKDADGKPFARQIVELARTGKPGWVDFRWPNPVSKEVEAKTTYVEPVDGKLYFTAGIYR